MLFCRKQLLLLKIDLRWKLLSFFKFLHPQLQLLGQKVLLMISYQSTPSSILLYRNRSTRNRRGSHHWPSEPFPADLASPLPALPAYPLVPWVSINQSNSICTSDGSLLKVGAEGMVK